MNSLSEDTSIHIREGVRSYKFPKHNTNDTNDTNVLFRFLQHPPIVESPLTYIALFIHLNPYLSTCPISHLHWPSVSCVSQGNTVQTSSSHKCGQ